MANMSYCRFQNTAQDLEDCVHVLSDAVEEETALDLSAMEQGAFEKMLQLAHDFIDLAEQLEASQNS